MMADLWARFWSDLLFWNRRNGGKRRVLRLRLRRRFRGVRMVLCRWICPRGVGDG